MPSSCPIQEVREGRAQPILSSDLLTRMFADNERWLFLSIIPMASAGGSQRRRLPAKATRINAPEVIDALESDIGRGVSIRSDPTASPIMYVAVLVQREIEVIGILRLAVPMAPSRKPPANHS